MNERTIQLLDHCCSNCCCFCHCWVASVIDVEDVERRKSDVDRYNTTSTTWQDSDEPVECQLARSGRHKVSQQSDTDRHAHCRSVGSRYDHRHHDHQHAVADHSDLRADWNWTDHATHDERQQCVDYEQQLYNHGWRMEVHGDPLNIKCVLCRALIGSTRCRNPAVLSIFSTLFSFELFFVSILLQLNKT